jgi:hypothetical protein
VVSLVTAALSILAVILEIIVQNRQTPQEKRNAIVQQGRADIQDGNIDSVEQRVDVLLTDQNSTGNSPAGEPSAKDVERRISQL